MPLRAENPLLGEPRLSPAGVLALQRTAGNQAVGRLLAPAPAPSTPLLQRLSKDAKKKLARPPYSGEYTTSDVEAWQKRGKLTDGDVDKLLRLQPTEFIEAVGMDPGLFKGAAGTDDVDEFFQRAKTKAKSAALAVESQRQSEALTRPQQKSALQLALEGAGASPDDAASFLNREKNHEPIRAWVPNTPAAVVKRAVEVVLGKNVSFAQVTALLTRNGQLRNYDQKKVLDWVMSYGLTNVADALENTQTETSTAWVETWLTTGATAQSSTTFKKLVRLQARITGSAAGLRVFQRDVEYVSSLDPPSRTGFLSYDFGGDDVELHTHWNVTKKKVASIHVKEGADKSTEINQWSFFGPISAAVVAAHNTATGNLAATTDPPGEQLTL